MAIIKIPKLYSFYTNHQTEIVVGGATIGSILSTLFQQYPAIEKHLKNNKGELRRHINLFINKTNIKDLEGMESAVSDSDTITILPNISGG